MSHFTALVIGPDIEKQLQPFHEFECTGTVDEYVVDVDKTEEVRERMAKLIAEGKNPREALTEALDYHGLDSKRLTPGEEPQVHEGGKHQYGYVRVDSQGFLVQAVRRTNPNAKWDWYQVGGRWSGFFKLKKGAPGELGERSLLDKRKDERVEKGLADIIRKRDIDVDATREEEGAKAAKHYDEVRAVLDKHPKVESWASVLERFGDKKIELARDFYHAQAGIQALGKLRDWNFNPDDFYVERKAFIQKARDAALLPFAYVRESRWFERGDMGWWGVVRDEKDPDAWARDFNKMFDELPDDTLITAVDCHI